MEKAGKYRSIVYSNFFEYFYYFALLSFLIIIILGGSMYFYFSSVFKKEAIQSSNNILSQLMNAQEFILSDIDTSLAHIVLDSTVTNYEDYYKSRNYTRMMAAEKKLDDTVASCKYLHSIHIYYFESNTILSSTSGHVKIEEFYDSDFLSQVLEGQISKNLVKARKLREKDGLYDKEVLSFIKTIPINYSGRPRAIVIINLERKYLRETINSININSGSFVLIAGKDGKIISQENDAPFLQGLDISQYIDLGDESSSGYYIRTIKGERMLLSFTYSRKYNWRYILLIPMSDITTNIRFLGVMTLLFCLLLIILSVIGSVVLSKKIYSPIKAMLTLFKRNDALPDTAREEGRFKETVIINESINRLIDRNKSLEQIFEEYKMYHRNKFLQGLINGNYEDTDNISERISYYGVDVDINGGFAVYVISMDNFKDFSRKYSERQQNMLLVYIEEIARKVMFSRYGGFVVEGGMNEIVVVVSFKFDENVLKVKQDIYSAARRIHSMITENFKYTFTIGVSNTCQGIRKLHNCYEEGAAAVNYRILLGYNQVILSENMASNETASVSYPFFIEKDIVNNLKVGNREDILEGLDRFSQYIHENLTESIEHVRHYFLQLLSSSIKCAYEIESNFDAGFVLQKDAYEELLKEETMQGMLASLKRFYDIVLGFVEERRSHRNRELIVSVTDYINSTLEDSGLTIEKLAEQFFISPSYLRKIFKDETNMTIKEYINNQRMEKAKELLETSNCRIGDIAEKIGYLSVQAFNKAFKFYTGKTSGEYRNLHVVKMQQQRNGNKE